MEAGGMIPCDRAAGTTTAAVVGAAPAAVTAKRAPPHGDCWAAARPAPLASRSAAVLPTAGGVQHSGTSALQQPSPTTGGSRAASTALQRSAAVAILRRAKQRARRRASPAVPGAATIAALAAAVEGGVPGQPDIMVQDAHGPAMQPKAPVPPVVPPAAGVGGVASATVAASAAPRGPVQRPPQQLHGDGDLGGGRAAVGMDLDLDLDLDLQAPMPRQRGRALPGAAQPTDLAAGGGVPAGLLPGPPPHHRDHAAAQHLGGSATATTPAAGALAVAEGPGGSAYSASLPQQGEVVSWRTCLNGWELRQGYLRVPVRVASSGALGTAWHEGLQRLLSAVPPTRSGQPQRDMLHPLDVVDEGTGATHRVELRLNVLRRQDGQVRRWGTHVAKLMGKLRGKVAEGDTLVFRAGPYSSGGSGTVPAPPPASAAGQEPGGGAPATGSADVGAPAAAGASCSGAGLPQPAATARVWMRHVPRQQPQQGGGDAAAGAVDAGGGEGRRAGGGSSSSDGDGDSQDEDDGDDDDEYHTRPSCAGGRQPPAGATRMAAPGRGGQHSGGTACGAQGRCPRQEPATAGAQQHGQQRPPAALRAPCAEWSYALTASHSQRSGAAFYLPVTTDPDCAATFRPYLDALRSGNSCDGDRAPGADGGGVAAKAGLAGQQRVGTVYAAGKGTLKVNVAVVNRLRPQLGPQPAELQIAMVAAVAGGGSGGGGRRAAVGVVGETKVYVRQIFKLLREAGLREGDTITFSRHSSVQQGKAGQRAGGGVGAGAAATPRLPRLTLSWGGTQAGGLTRPELPGGPGSAFRTAAATAAAEHSSAAGTAATDTPPPALVAEWSHILKAAHVRLGATFGLPVLLKRSCRATFQPFVDALLGSCASAGGGPACSAASASPAGPAACCRQPVAYLSDKGVPTVSVAVDNRLRPQQLGPQPAAAELRIAMYKMRGSYSLHFQGILKLLREAGLREGDTITFSRHCVPRDTPGQRGSGVGTGAAAAMPPLPALITLTCSRRNRGNEQHAARPQDNEEEEEDEEEEDEDEVAVDKEAEEERAEPPQRGAGAALTGSEGGVQAAALAGTAAPNAGLVAGSERAAGPLAVAIPAVNPVPHLASLACGPVPVVVAAPAAVVPRAPVAPGGDPAATRGLQAKRRPPPRSAVPAAAPPAVHRPAAAAAAGLADAAIADAAAPAARSRPAGAGVFMASSPLAAATTAEDQAPAITPPAQLAAPATRGQQGRRSRSPPRKRAKHSGSGTVPPQQLQAEGGAGGKPATWHCAAGAAGQPQAMQCRPAAGALPCLQQPGPPELPEQCGASSAAEASAHRGRSADHPPPGGAASSSLLAPLAPSALPPEVVRSTVLIDACDEVLAAVELLFPCLSMAALAALADALNAAPTHWPPVRQSQLVRQLLPRLRGAVRQGGEAGAQRAAVYVKSFLAVDMMS